jgi:hypothetical protein
MAIELSRRPNPRPGSVIKLIPPFEGDFEPLLSIWILWLLTVCAVAHLGRRRSRR